MLIQRFLNNRRWKKFCFEYRQKNLHNFTEIGEYCDISRISVGKNTYGTIFLKESTNKDVKLKIGNYCSIGGGVEFLLGLEHSLENISTYPFKVKILGDNKEALTKGDIIIDDDVWIGTHVIILSGVHIGKGAVIGAGTIVTKDVEPYSVYAGNPAKIIKYRFPKDIISKLMQVDICSLYEKFSSKNAALFYSKLDDTVLNELLKL